MRYHILLRCFFLKTQFIQRAFVSSFLFRSTIGLNSLLSFSKICCHNKLKDPNPLSYLPIAERRTEEYIYSSKSGVVNNYKQDQ